MVSDIVMPGLHFYQSANADTAIIKDNFVVRTHEYDIIIDDIRNNPMHGSVQHYLLLGRRGSGKSTLLKRLQIEIDTDEVLQQTHVAINLAEEQANIYRLYDLLEEIIQELEYRNIEVEKPDWDANENSFSRKLFDAIHTAIERSGKKVVLLLDNIDRIFENLKEDAGLLREMLLNYSDIKIIGGSTRMTEHFWKYNQPFYQFFRVLEMKPLSSDEIKKLLLHWSEKLDLPILKEFVEKRTGQLETIRILTDGLPRTLQFFLNILIKRTHETGYEYLRLIMDQVTPLYQERLNTLPPSQRKIVLQMAFIWEAAGAKELAEASRMDNKLISAQLKQLIEKGIAEKVETKTKNHLYRLSERFFNLWLIFTQGSPEVKRKQRCLTIFLENFYDKEDLKSQILAYLELLRKNKLAPNTAALLTKVYAQSKFISADLRNELISQTFLLPNINNELKNQMPLLTTKIYDEAIKLINEQRWDDVLKKVNDVEQDDGLKNFFIGTVYDLKQKYDLAEKHYLLASKKNIPGAFLILGMLYESRSDLALAEKYYQLALKNRNDLALVKLGFLYKNQKKSVLAEEYFLLTVDAVNKSTKSELQYDHLFRVPHSFDIKIDGVAEQMKSAFFELAIIYEQKRNFSLAEKYYLQAFDNGIKISIVSLGNLYYKEKNFLLAEKYYLLAIKNGFDFAKLTLASLYYDQNINKNDALELVNQVGYLGDDDEIKICALIIIKFWNGLTKEASNELVEMIDGKRTKHLSNTLIDVLYHHQINFVNRLFSNPKFGNDLINQFQPVYYVTRLLADKDNIQLKIPPELEETVNDIIKDIKQKQTFYYGSSQITVGNN